VLEEQRRQQQQQQQRAQQQLLEPLVTQLILYSMHACYTGRNLFCSSWSDMQQPLLPPGLQQQRHKLLLLPLLLQRLLQLALVLLTSLCCLQQSSCILAGSALHLWEQQQVQELRQLQLHLSSNPIMHSSSSSSSLAGSALVPAMAL
jgi:hypothetical protein